MPSSRPPDPPPPIRDGGLPAPSPSPSAGPPPAPQPLHSPLSTSPTRYADPDAYHPTHVGQQGWRQPPRGGSGSSTTSAAPLSSSRGVSPSRRGSSGDSDPVWPPSSRQASAPSSRQNSGDRLGGHAREGTDAGLAGRGAGGTGLGRGNGLPVLNTHMLPGGGGLLSPTSSSHSHGGGGMNGDHRASLLAQPPPLHAHSLASPASDHRPHVPRSPSNTNGRATPSPTFPPSHSNSTLSSHSHSQSHSYFSNPSSRSPTVPGFPKSVSSSSSSNAHGAPASSANTSPFMHAPSRPASASSHSHSHSHDNGGSRSRGNSAASSTDGRGRARDKGAVAAATCAKCELPMTGQFVRALGTVYHLDCFRCQDCNKVVAAKFFPIDAPEGGGRQVPLCETDYFRRLGLLCHQCGQALRGSYITALDMKFHVEHFTCSVCPTVFGPQDSYYEHGGSVYCHFHYSTRFAVKCTGCRTAILKQFVEINRNSIDEHWHPECYMIHKFWNLKLAPAPKLVERPPSVADPADPSSSSSSPAIASAAPPDPPEYLAIEASETPASLKAQQRHMEEQVYRIWTILSAFEESSAACISEMLRHVSSGHYMEGVGMAEKFVLHVETLFAAIDDLNAAFRAAGAKEMSHVREARMLCKKVVNFFMLLSHTHETGARKMSITQELLSLVTGLAHYLKILIRIALTGSLKLEREHANAQAIGLFLGRLDRLARDPEANKISATVAALVKNGTAAKTQAALEPPSRKNSDQSTSSASENGADGAATESSTVTPGARPTYGYKSLVRAVGTLIGQGEATTDLCEGCRLTVEEECARLGTSVRWHLPCLRCPHCHRAASKDPVVAPDAARDEVHVAEFVWVDGAGDDARGAPYCRECALRERGGSLEGTTPGAFAYVTRLEQYAFLLCVALNKLFGRLKQRGVVGDGGAGAADEASDEARSLSDAYRDSTDIKRMKSVQLDRKLSAGQARTPLRSTVVQSPSGRTATSDATDPSFSLFQAKPPVPSRKDQPLVDPVRGTTIPRSQGVREVVPPPLHPAKSSQATPTSLSIVTTPHGSHAPTPDRTASPLSAAFPRPAFNRTTTAVRIVDDEPSGAGPREPEGLGGASEPTQDGDGLTLADLPKALEAEQRRSDPSRPSPSLGAPGGQGGAGGALSSGLVGANPLSSGPKLLSELSALEYFIVKHVAAVLLSSEASALRDAAPLDELLEIIDARKNTFWGKLFKGGREEKKSVKKKGVFGIPLEVLVERNGADSMHGAGPGSLRIPSFVDDVISAMKQMDMSIEGIFRKNGNIRRLKDLTEALDRDSGSVNLSDDNPVQLAALLKKFLRDLPDPLMTFKLFHLFIAAQRIDDFDERKRMLHYVCCLLPKPHRDTMEVLFVFLKWVASFSHVDEETGSKMDLQNLATVISPNILYAKGKDPARDESFSSARVVHELLELQDEFWEVPAECLSILNDQELFANPSQLTSKEILARAENHIRLFGRGGGFKVSRGEASPPRRPGLQEAWSAPAVPGGGPGGSRPLSTSVSPSQLLRSPDRPISFANQQHPSGPIPPHPAGLPLPRSGSTTPWAPAPPQPGRYEDVYRRGGSEGNASSSSLHQPLHSQPPSHAPSPQLRGVPHTSATHPYQQTAPPLQR
ncbi:Rho-type GTPase activating protein Rga1 [Rhodotorula kratochvilovae]